MKITSGVVASATMSTRFHFTYRGYRTPDMNAFSSLARVIERSKSTCLSENVAFAHLDLPIEIVAEATPPERLSSHRVKAQHLVDELFRFLEFRVSILDADQESFRIWATQSHLWAYQDCDRSFILI